MSQTSCSSVSSASSEHKRMHHHPHEAEHFYEKGNEYVAIVVSPPLLLLHLWTPSSTCWLICEANGKKIICNRFMVIQQSWNVIIKALWGAENSMNKTFQGQQPTPSVPLHYFTYLQPKQAKLPPPRRLLAVAETGTTPSTVHLLFLFVGGVNGWVGWCWPRWGRRGWRETLTLN